MPLKETPTPQKNGCGGICAGLLVSVTRRRVERVCHDIEKLIGPDARGVTVEVDGSRCGEAEPQKKKEDPTEEAITWAPYGSVQAKRKKNVVFGDHFRLPQNEGFLALNGEYARARCSSGLGPY
jgi:hypothetical protein